jgi:uncharacterized protein
MRAIFPIALMLTLSFNCPPALCQLDELPPSISVSGEGKASGKPDIAEVIIGVATTGNTSTEAVSSNNKAMSSLMAALTEEGIKPADITTSGFSLFPEYEQDSSYREPRGAVKPRITGFRANNQVAVRVRNVANIGSLLDHVVRAGANNIHGINFTFSDISALTDEARRKAVADADRRAKVFAQAAGINLGPLLYIQEGHPTMPMSRAAMRMAASGTMATEVPMSVGEQEVRSDITAIYAIPSKAAPE